MQKKGIKDTLAKMTYTNTDLTKKVINTKKSLNEIQSIINGKGTKKS